MGTEGARDDRQAAWHPVRPCRRGAAQKRKRSDERVTRFRPLRPGDLPDLKRRCIRWAADNLISLRDAALDVAVPDGLNDRAADNWEPLLAIADRAGGDWPERARKAALALSGNGARRGCLDRRHAARRHQGNLRAARSERLQRTLETNTVEGTCRGARRDRGPCLAGVERQADHRECRRETAAATSIAPKQFALWIAELERLRAVGVRRCLRTLSFFRPPSHNSTSATGLKPNGNLDNSTSTETTPTSDVEKSEKDKWKQ